MEKKSWFKGRGYLHLTQKINPIAQKAEIFGKVQNSDFVAKHAFFPLLHKTIPQRRYKKVNQDGKIIRSHTEVKNGKVVSTKKLRPIHYATHIDSQIYAYYSNEILQKKYEVYLSNNTELSAAICAYRRIPTDDGLRNKCNIDFAKEAFDEIKNRGECVAMAFDIENFFTSLDHNILKKTWANFLGKKSLPPDHYNIFKSVTNYSYIELDDFRRNKQGGFDEKHLAKLRKNGIQAFFENPQEFREQIQNGEISIYKNQFHNENGEIVGTLQGLPISAMLANLYLLAFDEYVLEHIVKNFGACYRRYSDDILVICTKENYAIIQNLLIEKIKDFKLKIAAHKTEVCFFEKNEQGILKVTRRLDNGKFKPYMPLVYLGFEFYGDKTLLKSANLARFYRDMKDAVKTKARRIKYMQQKELTENVPLFKRKLYRLYSYKGIEKRKWKTKQSRLVLDKVTNSYKYVQTEKEQKYRGNYLSYAFRASEIMQEPAIKRQIRRHWRILRNTIKKRILE